MPHGLRDSTAVTLTESLRLFPGDHSVLIIQICWENLGLFHKDSVSLARTIVVPESTFLKKLPILILCSYVLYAIISLSGPFAASFK